MKQKKPCARARILIPVFVGLLSLHNTIQAAVPRMAGDWQIMVERDGAPMPALLWLSLDKDEKLTGKWISVWGASDLIDLQHTDDTLRFRRVSRYRGQEATSSFVSHIKKGKLTGVVTRGTQESKVTGERMQPVKRPAGNWEMEVRVGEEAYPATLQISAGAQGDLLARWQSQWGEHEITDVAFKNPELTFKRRSTIQDRQWDSVFKGKIEGHTLAGTFEGERDTIAAQGKRVGAALVGRWELRIPSESGERTQILRVYPDLSGLYGPLPVDKVNLDGADVTFKAGGDFGDRKIQYNFAGRLDGKTICGELTGTRGVQTIEGAARAACRAFSMPQSNRA